MKNCVLCLDNQKLTLTTLRDLAWPFNTLAMVGHLLMMPASPSHRYNTVPAASRTHTQDTERGNLVSLQLHQTAPCV